MGKHATHCVLAAQLLLKKDGETKNHGLHFFVVPLRDVVTHLPFPGVEVGDLGPKMGWNWIDHGYLKLNQYRIPRESLLNRYQVNHRSIAATKSLRMFPLTDNTYRTSVITNALASPSVHLPWEE